MTIGKNFGIDMPVGYSPEKKLVPPMGVAPDQLMGVELEIENLDRDVDRRAVRIVKGMDYHEDGSLRNNGGEYVTKPMTLGVLDYVLNEFFLKNKFTENNYSERCSVHVHMNCVDMDFDQVKTVAAMYQILEKVLFNYIQGDRKDNIFCVPLHETLMTHDMLVNTSYFLTAIKGWKKYTAFNMAPLSTYGTIEFRHMAGTHDKDRIIQWCNILAAIFKFAKENKFEDIIDGFKSLNTSSAYTSFLLKIFPVELYTVLATGDYRRYLEEGVMNMKLALMTQEKVIKPVEIPPMIDDWDDDDDGIPMMRRALGHNAWAVPVVDNVEAVNRQVAQNPQAIRGDHAWGALNQLRARPVIDAPIAGQRPQNPQPLVRGRGR
jgi:hypothetical protein